MIPLDYICFNAYNGYSASARSNILALYNSGQYSIRVTPLDQKTDEEVSSHFNLFSYFSSNYNSDIQIQVYHCVPDMQKRVKRKIFTVGWGIFENTNPPSHWIDILNTNNVVLTPSKFCQNIFESRCDVPVNYVPHCLDMNIYNKDVKPMNKYDKFTYLFLGSWKERKGYKTLLKAWFEEFDQNDNVQLVIKTDKPLIAEQLVLRMRKKYSAPVIVLKQNYTDDEMPAFMKSADCLVTPSLGEGFYMPGIQAMAVGVPVIITDFSGCRDYANEDTSFLLKPEGFVNIPCLDNIPQFSNCSWAFISVNQLRKQMRNVLVNPNKVAVKVDNAYNMVRKDFCYEKTAESFLNAISPITSKMLTKNLVAI